jgi:prolyl oligopeptidase
MFGVGATECGRYVTMSTSKDTARENLFWVADLQASEIGMEMKWTKVVNEWGAYYGELGNDGSKFYFYTSANDSPNYKVVTYDLEHPELVRPSLLLSNAY